jgi:Protein of unknown function (DUF2934)
MAMKTRLPSTPKAEEEQEFSNTELESTIRRRAYELYKQRGFVDGNELDDWLRAEEEIRELNEKSRTR